LLLLLLLLLSSDFLLVFVSLGVVDDDVIGDGDFNSVLSLGVVGLHDLYLDSHDSLLEEDVSDGDVDEVQLRLSGADHVSLLELHGLGSLLL